MDKDFDKWNEEKKRLHADPGHPVFVSDMALPLSTRKKIEKFQSEVSHRAVHGFALLDQIRVLDTKRLRRKIGNASKGEFLMILDKFNLSSVISTI